MPGSRKKETSIKKTSNDQRKKKLAMKLAASTLAVSASLAGAGAFADQKHGGYRDNQGYAHTDAHRQNDGYRNVKVWSNQQNLVRVHIPVRDHGPEVLPLGRLISQNSNIDLNRYRLKAVVTKNGRFSNGYASLRTGDRKTGRYLLRGYEYTKIPAPSRADNTWRLRLGPGTRVRSITAVLEPRQHGWAHRSNHVYDRSNLRQQSHEYRYRQSAQTNPWAGLAWYLSNSADDKAKHNKQKKRLKKTRAELARSETKLERTQEKLKKSRDRNKTLKQQRERLAEELAYDNKNPKKGQKPAADRNGHRRDAEQDSKRTKRYVINGGGKYSGTRKHS